MPGVRDQRHALARPEGLEDPVSLPALVVLEVGRRRGGDSVPAEHPAGVPRVLAGHEVCFPQDPKGAHRQVLEIADRGGHDVENAGGLWTADQFDSS